MQRADPGGEARAQRPPAAGRAPTPGCIRPARPAPRAVTAPRRVIQRDRARDSGSWLSSELVGARWSSADSSLRRRSVGRQDPRDPHGRTLRCRRARARLPSRSRAASGRSPAAARGGSCVRVVAPPLWRLTLQPEREPAKPAISSADAGTTWRWAISRLRLPITCSASGSFPERLRSASSWVPSTRLMPAERARPNRRTTCSGATAENSSMRASILTGRACEAATTVCRSCTIAAASIWLSSGLLSERSVNRTTARSRAQAQEIDRLRARVLRLAARRRRRTRTAPRAGRARRRGRRAGGRPASPGRRTTLARAHPASPRRSCSRFGGSRYSTSRARVTVSPAEAQRPHLVAEIALRLAEIVGLGEALRAEGLVGDLRLRSPCERVVDVRALGRPLEEPPAARRGRRRSAARAAPASPLGSITTAPMPPAIAATAMRAWVTVLPEPVAPTTSVWVPPAPPPNGTGHPAPAFVVAEQQRAASPPPVRRGRQRCRGTGQEPGRERQRRAAPAKTRLRRRCRPRGRFAASDVGARPPDSPPNAIGSAAWPRTRWASTHSTPSGGRPAPVQAVPAHQPRAEEAGGDGEHALRGDRGEALRAPPSSWTGGASAARRTGTSEGMSPSFQVPPPSGGGDGGRSLTGRVDGSGRRRASLRVPRRAQSPGARRTTGETVMRRRPGASAAPVSPRTRAKTSGARARPAARRRLPRADGERRVRRASLRVRPREAVSRDRTWR